MILEEFLGMTPAQIADSNEIKEFIKTFYLSNRFSIPSGFEERWNKFIEKINAPILYKASLEKLAFNKQIVLTDEHNMIVHKSRENHPEGWISTKFKGYEYIQDGNNRFVYSRLLNPCEI